MPPEGGFLSGALVWHFFLMSLQVLAGRNGTVGGEILFLYLSNERRRLRGSDAPLFLFPPEVQKNKRAC